MCARAMPEQGDCPFRDLCKDLQILSASACKFGGGVLAYTWSKRGEYKAKESQEYEKHQWRIGQASHRKADALL